MLKDLIHDLAATVKTGFSEAARTWRRMRRLRNLRASTTDPFTTD